MTAALTNEQKHLLNDYDPALQKAGLGTLLDNATDGVIALESASSGYAINVPGTPSAETGGPPDYIDIPCAVKDEDGVALAAAVNVRVRIYDDATCLTESTVGAHRLTTNGVTPVLTGDDSVDAVYRFSTVGVGTIRIEDVAGASGVSQYLLITDGGNEVYRVRGSVVTVTFN